MKKNKAPILMDERSKLLAYRIISLMYILTILSLQGVILYRQLVLGQDIHDFEDLAVIATINAIFLVAALLYFGAVSLRRIPIRTILLVYLLILVLGTAFIYLKYEIIQDAGLGLSGVLGKVYVVASISGLLVLFWVLMSILGKRRTDRSLED